MAFTFNQQLSQNQIKKLPGFNRAHFENMGGTEWDSHVYCGKDDKEPFEFGKKPQPGKRNDLLLLTDRMFAGRLYEDILYDDQSLAPTFVRTYRGVQCLDNLIMSRRPKPIPKVFWLYGRTGTHKTTVSRLLGELLYGKEQVWMSHSGLQWFTGYHGHQCAVLDDLRGSDGKFNFLLRLLDLHPLQVPTKGGHAPWIPSVIFIATAKSIDETYSQRASNDWGHEELAQLHRRTERGGHYQFPCQTFEFLERFREVFKTDYLNMYVRPDGDRFIQQRNWPYDRRDFGTMYDPAATDIESAIQTPEECDTSINSYIAQHGYITEEAEDQSEESNRLLTELRLLVGATKFKKIQTKLREGEVGSLDALVFKYRRRRILDDEEDKRRYEEETLGRDLLKQIGEEHTSEYPAIEFKLWGRERPQPIQVERTTVDIAALSGHVSSGRVYMSSLPGGGPSRMQLSPGGLEMQHMSQDDLVMQVRGDELEPRDIYFESQGQIQQLSRLQGLSQTLLEMQLLPPSMDGGGLNGGTKERLGLGEGTQATTNIKPEHSMGHREGSGSNIHDPVVIDDSDDELCSQFSQVL